MKPKEKAIEALQHLRLEKKFMADESTFYPGLENESIRGRITDLINRGVDEFISVVKSNGTEKDFQQAIGKGLSYFEILDYSLDTEDRERVCGYFEEMMDAVGLESSGGILNRWRLVQTQGIDITVTNTITGYTTVKGYPNQVLDADGNKVLYTVPLYKVIVSGLEDGKKVSQTFNAIRFGVYNKTGGKAPFVTGVNSGTYNATWGTMSKLGEALYLEGAGNGNVWLHVGPVDGYTPGANRCVEIFGWPMVFL
jgi:hypothetical protein